MARSTCLLVIALSIPTLLSGERQGTSGAAGLRTIRGQVVANEPGAPPVRRARVSASGTNIVSDPVYTDERGRFELAVPASAPYSLRISKAGFVPYMRTIRASAVLPDDTRPVAAGEFRLSSVPPGDYWIVAVDRFEASTERQDLDVMASLASVAERITVREHERAVRDFRLVQRP
jgi:hypothetical protein